MPLYPSRLVDLRFSWPVWETVAAPPLVVDPAGLENDRWMSTPFDVTQVLPKTSEADAVVLVLGEGARSGARKRWSTRAGSGWQNDHNVPAVAKVSIADEEDDVVDEADGASGTRRTLVVDQASVEREVMRTFPNAFLDRRMSPNFVGFRGTLWLGGFHDDASSACVAPLSFGEGTSSGGTRRAAAFREQIQRVHQQREANRHHRSASATTTTGAERTVGPERRRRYRRRLVATLMEHVPRLVPLESFRRSCVLPGSAVGKRVSTIDDDLTVQLLMALHVMKCAGLMHWDLHTHNIGVATQTRRAFPDFHRQPLYFVVPATQQRESDDDVVVFRVFATNRLVKIFDWDMAGGFRCGGGGSRPHAHEDRARPFSDAFLRSDHDNDNDGAWVTERDREFCNPLGRCDTAFRPEYDLVNALHRARPLLLLTDEELSSGPERTSEALDALREWWGEHGRAPPRLAAPWVLASCPFAGRWNKFWDSHRALWDPLALLHRLASNHHPSTKLLADFVPAEHLSSRTFYSPTFSAERRESLRVRWAELESAGRMMNEFPAE